MSIPQPQNGPIYQNCIAAGYASSSMVTALQLCGKQLISAPDEWERSKFRIKQQ
jgi:hypothetical protein